MTKPPVKKVSKAVLKKLAKVSTPTITYQLMRHHGLNNTGLRDVLPLDPDLPRFAGPAFTLRYLPMRADLAEQQYMDHKANLMTPAIEAGEATFEQQTGIPAATISSISRMAPSVTAAATPRRASRITILPPRRPTSRLPPDSIRNTAPSGQSSMAGVIRFALWSMYCCSARSARIGR